MNTPNAKKGITLRYVKNFQCTGPDCPDTCCHDWDVGIERGTYEKLQQVLPLSQLKANIKKGAKDKSGDYAVIALKEDGACPFLDPSDALCTIQKRYGESYLSLICRQYPRQVSMIGDSIELGLNISCPEAARLCLLDESATDLVEFDPEMLLKKGIGFYHTQPGRPANHYLTYVNDFREIMLQLLANRNLPFDSRLFIALYFARQVSVHVQEGVNTVDEGKVVQELELMLTPGYMDDLHSEFDSLPHSSDFSMSLLQTIILARITHKGILSQLIPAILAENGIKVEFAGDNMELNAETGLNRAFENMLLRYQQRRTLLVQKFATTIDQYFENYSRNFWFKDLFIKSPSLASHMQNLVLRIAVVKFLFFCNPALNPLFDAAETLTPEAAKKILDDAAVNTFYQFSRGIEHDKEFLSKLHTELGKQQMDSFAHLVLLLKF